MLKTSMLEVKRQIGALPGAAVLSYGTAVRASIKNEGIEGYAECARGHILLSVSAGARSRCGTLLIFLSFLAALSGCYEVPLAQLYARIIDALADAARLEIMPHGAAASLEIMRERIEALSAVNAGLASRIVECLASAESLRDEAQLHMGICADLMLRLRGAYGAAGAEELLRSIGMRSEHIGAMGRLADRAAHGAVSK